MKYIPLGSTDLQVSRWCFGCATIGGYDYGPADDAESIAAVRRAVDLGVTFFDTADVYGFGRAERILREALGPRIRDLVIATKFGVGWTVEGKTYRDLSPAHLRAALEGSLTRLGLETIPLYQIHWPDSRTSWEDCMAELQNCQAEGKIRHIGACNLSIDNLQACLGVGRLESLQVPFSLAEQQHRPALEYAVSSQMTTLGYNVLAHGFFTGKFGSQSTFSGTDLRGRIPLLTEGNRGRVFALLERIRAASTITGLTPAQVAIGWALAQSALNVVLVGARSAQQVEESAGQVDTALSAEALTLLDG